MTDPELTLAQAFEAFQARFDDLFVRCEPRQHFRAYMRGLLAPVQRKNCWQLAESVGLAGPQTLQRLLHKDRWADAAMGCRLREVVAETENEAALIGVVDESGVVKRGQHSVGVKRQYCGRLGKVENCQVGVYLSYVSAQRQALLDCELYLPAEWCADAQRRAAAQVPPEVSFKTKPQLALQMLDRAWAEGLALDWITADTAYGNSPVFRNHIHRKQRHYVAAIAKSTRLQRPQRQSRQTAAQLAALIPTSQWELWVTDFGEKGELRSERI